MPIRIVRLGSPRLPGEGTRIGAVRRPPRGVRKERWAAENWFDVWFPLLSPSPETVRLAQATDTPASWRAFERRYRREMAAPDARHALELLAALSHAANLSVGCFCEDERRCHRSILRELLRDHGARLV